MVIVFAVGCKVCKRLYVTCSMVFVFVVLLPSFYPSYFYDAHSLTHIRYAPFMLFCILLFLLTLTFFFFFSSSFLPTCRQLVHNGQLSRADGNNKWSLTYLRDDVLHYNRTKKQHQEKNSRAIAYVHSLTRRYTLIIHVCSGKTLFRISGCKKHTYEGKRRGGGMRYLVC